ncbi:hypothetical protein JZ751_006551 [Albula glossodonta]|uniref:Uncharacterized protein n=1 Tax=Albula glossodonta TaxID=121402 RepID=A0A8T2NAT6_9TELE|nr:hypothetical protein JZ751_006551 [Albula glossodonta]
MTTAKNFCHAAWYSGVKAVPICPATTMVMQSPSSWIHVKFLGVQHAELGVGVLDVVHVLHGTVQTVQHYGAVSGHPRVAHDSCSVGQGYNGEELVNGQVNLRIEVFTEQHGQHHKNVFWGSTRSMKACSSLRVRKPPGRSSIFSTASSTPFMTVFPCFRTCAEPGLRSFQWAK